MAQLKVYAADDAILKDYLTDSYLSVMEKVVQQSAPQIVLLGLTQIGRDLDSPSGFPLKTVATLDCIGLEIDAATKEAAADQTGIRRQCSISSS